MGIWTQGLMFARQAPATWATPPTTSYPFAKTASHSFGGCYFVDWILPPLNSATLNMIPMFPNRANAEKHVTREDKRCVISRVEPCRVVWFCGPCSGHHLVGGRVGCPLLCHPPSSTSLSHLHFTILTFLPCLQTL
jgi:hypothetical protein